MSHRQERVLTAFIAIMQRSMGLPQNSERLNETHVLKKIHTCSDQHVLTLPKLEKELYLKIKRNFREQRDFS